MIGAKLIPFFPFGLLLYSLGLEFVAPSVAKCAGNFHAKKYVKLYMKVYIFIFYIYGF
jgi:hypothetical protein